MLVVFLLICAVYSGYALWDNEQIYAGAENAQSDMLSLKPKIEVTEEGEVDQGPSFADLLAINPDVCAWLTMDGTNIDYPVLQGETNLEYVSTDVYGNYSISGSIFLDVRCDREFHDNYSLLYGHHMDKNLMFGDLDFYEEPKFFEDNRTGELILPDRVYSLETFAYLTVEAQDDMIFVPQRWKENIDDLLTFTEENAKLLHQETIDEMRVQIDETDTVPQVIALTTCSSEYTIARTVVLAVIKDYLPPVNEEDIT